LQWAAVTAALIFWSFLILWLCFREGVQDDYVEYIDRWQIHPYGADPYYGPLHTVIGLLLPWGLRVPKLFMVGALLAANFALVLELMRERGMSTIQVIYLLAVPTNVLVVGMGVIYGLNDAFVAALLIVAVLLRLRGYLLAVGVLVGLAALTKYYPLLLLPFFALDGRRLRWSVIAGGTAVFFVGLTAAIAIWGQASFDAILFQSNRGPENLSIINALKSLFGDEGFVRWLITKNSYFVVLGVAAAFLFAWGTRLNWLEGAIIGYLVMLTFYKVGNQQYYIPWLFMIASLPLINKQSADRMAIIFLPAVLLLSLFHAGFDSGFAQNPDGWLRSYGGFIAFSVSVASIAACVFDHWSVVGQHSPDKTG